jgi:hypothetical protein
VALAAGQTVRDVAAAAGVGERTATRRWADPDFRRRVAELRADMVSRATGKMGDGLASLASSSVDSWSLTGNSRLARAAPRRVASLSAASSDRR